MLDPTTSPYLVPFDGSFRVASAPTAAPGKKHRKAHGDEKLAELVEKIGQLQAKLYASDDFALLLIFQAMDAAGKDGTVRAVTSGVNPAGFQIYAFKQPSAEELDHDFLWRCVRALPERGRIGIFNRSYYEEVIVVRVHPELLDRQKLPPTIDRAAIWQERFASLRHHERHLSRNGTVVLKFWLNVSPEEQRRRFLARIDDPEKSWKFSAGDVAESRCWEAYMEAYEEALAATSRPWAPWYAIPADDKGYARLCVAEIVADTLGRLPLRFPEPSEQERARMLELRRELEAEG